MLNYPYTQKLHVALRAAGFDAHLKISGDPEIEDDSIKFPGSPAHIQCGSDYCIVNCWTPCKTAMWHGPERKPRELALIIEDLKKFNSGLVWTSRGWIPMPPEEAPERM